MFYNMNCLDLKITNMSSSATLRIIYRVHKKIKYLSSQQTNYSQTFTESFTYKWEEVFKILWWSQLL